MQRDKAFGFMIKKVNDALEKYINNTVRKNDLTFAQVNVLLRLSDTPQKQASMKDLERFLEVAQSTTAGIVARLEQKGYVRGFADPSDKRIKMVLLTDAGEACCERCHSDIVQTENMLLSGLSEEERRTLQNLLARMRANIK